MGEEGRALKFAQIVVHKGMLIHPGKKTSKFEVLYLLGNFTLWSWCNDGEKCIKKCDACADR